MLLKQNEKADQTQQLASPRRRHLLAGSAVAMTAAGLAAFTRSAMAQAVASTVPAAKPLPAYVSWKDANAMIVHTSSTLETKRSAFGTSIITTLYPQQSAGAGRLDHRRS